MELISQIITLPKEETQYSKAIHGGTNILESRELNYGEVLDFSASISPINISSQILEISQKLDLSQYPDPDCLLLKEKITEGLKQYSLSPTNISIGNGSTELIYAIASAFLNKTNTLTSRSLIFHPTYGEYFAASSLHKAEISLITPKYINPGWQWEWELAHNFIQEHNPNLIFLCNPNNPTGNYFSKSQIVQLLEVIKNTSSILVVDEAYIDFVTDHKVLYDLILEYKLILLRSLTKSYGITGLRLGYSLANPEITSQINQYIPPWSVNTLAQNAGIHLFSGNNYIQTGKEMIDESKNYLIHALRELGYTVEPSTANFLLFKVTNAQKMRDALISKNIIIRDCTSFGLPQHVRIGIRSISDCEKLIEAIHEIT